MTSVQSEYDVLCFGDDQGNEFEEELQEAKTVETPSSKTVQSPQRETPSVKDDNFDLDDQEYVVLDEVGIDDVNDNNSSSHSNSKYRMRGDHSSAKFRHPQDSQSRSSTTDYRRSSPHSSDNPAVRRYSPKPSRSQNSKTDRTKAKEDPVKTTSSSGKDNRPTRDRAIPPYRQRKEQENRSNPSLWQKSMIQGYDGFEPRRNDKGYDSYSTQSSYANPLVGESSMLNTYVPYDSYKPRGNYGQEPRGTKQYMDHQTSNCPSSWPTGFIRPEDLMNMVLEVTKRLDNGMQKAHHSPKRSHSSRSFSNDDITVRPFVPGDTPNPSSRPFPMNGMSTRGYSQDDIATHPYIKEEPFCRKYSKDDLPSRTLSKDNYNSSRRSSKVTSLPRSHVNNKSLIQRDDYLDSQTTLKPSKRPADSYNSKQHSPLNPVPKQTSPLHRQSKRHSPLNPAPKQLSPSQHHSKRQSPPHYPSKLPILPRQSSKHQSQSHHTSKHQSHHVSKRQSPPNQLSTQHVSIKAEPQSRSPSPHHSTHYNASGSIPTSRSSGNLPPASTSSGDPNLAWERALVADFARATASPPKKPRYEAGGTQQEKKNPSRDGSSSRQESKKSPSKSSPLPQKRKILKRKSCDILPVEVKMEPVEDPHPTQTLSISESIVKEAQDKGVDVYYMINYEARAAEMKKKREEVERMKEQKRQAKAITLSSVSPQTPTSVAPKTPTSGPPSTPVHSQSSSQSSAQSTPGKSGPSVHQVDMKKASAFQNLSRNVGNLVAAEKLRKSLISAPTYPRSGSEHQWGQERCVRVENLDQYIGYRELDKILNLFGAGEIVERRPEQRRVVVKFNSDKLSLEFISRFDGFLIGGLKIRTFQI